jgi:hypothetical protein
MLQRIQKGVLCQKVHPVISRSTLLHLRIPFSFYLMPVFFFAAGTKLFTSDFLPSYPPLFNVYQQTLLYPGKYALAIVTAFLSIHLFLYPASNGFNSYYDRDEKAIGGLENPPPVSRELLYVSLLFDAIAIILGFILSWKFSLMLFIYGLVSKAYSHPAIRLKKYGVIAWLTAGIFQGGFTFLMVVVALQGLGFEPLNESYILFPACLATIMILGFYPLTQVYQHEEDAKHGDNTISRQLGIRGTFVLSLIMFLIADIGFYFLYNHSIFSPFAVPWFLIFQVFLAPVFSYFLWWFYRVTRNAAEANFKNTMRMNKIASWCLVSFFLLYSLVPYFKTVQIWIGE